MSLVKDCGNGRIEEPTAVLRFARRKTKSERHVEGMLRAIEVVTETLVLQQRVLVSEGSRRFAEWRDVPTEAE